MTKQLGLFDPPAPKVEPVAPRPDPAQAVHWAVVGSQRARTACGMVIVEFFHHERPRRALVKDTARRINISLDRYEGVTCPRCLELP